MSHWALVSGQALSLLLARASSDSGRLVDQEPEWTAVSRSTKSCGKKAQVVLESISQYDTKWIRVYIFYLLFFKKRCCICPKLTSITLFKHKILVTQLTSAAVLKDSSGGEELWQVVLSLDFGVHLQPVRQESRGSLMIFDIRTSRCSEDMNKTYSPSDHRPETFRVPNEIWGVISFHTHTKKSLCQISVMLHEICMTFM